MNMSINPNPELRGVASEIASADVDNPDSDIPGQVFADLGNLVLELRHPAVRFLDDNDLDIARNNGVPDVSSLIDYRSVVCAPIEELVAELRDRLRKG